MKNGIGPYFQHCQTNLLGTHPIHQLSNHAVPDLGLCISCSVFAIAYDLELVSYTAVLCDLCGQVDTVAW